MYRVSIKNCLMRSMGTAFIVLLAVASVAAQDMGRPAGWTDESHGNRAAPNYELVLPDERINEIYITFTPEAWQAEEADMLEIYGERGTGGGAGRRGFGNPGEAGRPPWLDFVQLANTLERSEQEVRAAMALLPDFEAAAAALGFEIDALFEVLGLPSGFVPPLGLGGAGAPDRQNAVQLTERNPIWVPVTIQFGDLAWWEVGFRYKGNSTLSIGWRSGATALPFKLDFDEFEDEHPELDNQRFYGFKQLSFGTGVDPSLQREKVTADIFRAAGVPAAETAYYAVYVDKGAGDGFEYWGIYTAVELPDDTLIETQFADDNGNMYKPEGAGATFALGSFNEKSFDKETNGSSSYEDVLAVFDMLHADTRHSEPDTWQADLEAVFDVAGFLRWLAANTLLQNWDTYGVMSHNYYLYADAGTGKLVWIPWDNNMALQASVVDREGGSLPAVAGRRSGFGTALELALEVDAERWPLIGFLLEDAVYRQIYVNGVAELSADVFTPERMIPIYEENFALLAAYLQAAEGEEAVSALRAAADELIEHVQGRASAAEEFLAQQTAA